MRGGIEHRAHDGGGAVEQRDAVRVDAAEDLGAVDLADHDVTAAHAGHRVRHPPSVAMEHRQGVEVDVAVVHAGLPAEDSGVDPAVAVRELHALGPRRRAARVVDRRGGVLVGIPRLGLDALTEQLPVRVGADHEPVLRADGRQRVVELGVDEQHRGAGVLDDVPDLVGVEPEVDGHEDPARSADPEERHEQSGGIRRDDRDSLADADPEVVQGGGLGARELAHAPVGQLSERRGRLVGLVDDADPVAVHECGALQEVVDRQRHPHPGPPRTRTSCDRMLATG